MHTVLERGRDAHRNPCAHSYCVPAPPHAEKYPILAHDVCMSIAFLLFPSTFFRAHFYCVPALSACISIALQHSLHAFLLYPSTIFQHCMRAFLSIFKHFSGCIYIVLYCMYVCIVCVLYCIVWTQCMCCIVCVCMCLYVLVGRVAPQTRMLFRRTLYQNVPVLILLKINDMGPYGIHLITPHCISITLLLHYYTSESQHFLRVLTLFFASSQPASQSS